LDTNIKALFKSFIQNECNVDELKQVRQIILSGEYLPEWEAAMLETNVQQDTFSTSHFDSAKMYSNIRKTARIDTKPFKMPVWVGYAAAVLIVVFIAYFMVLQNQQRDDQAKIAANSKVNMVSNHRWVKLPDGTSVQLNTNSHIEYPENFDGKATREVTLTGEAFFDVKHDSKHPFVIHTGKIITTVLGTAFNISAYRPDQSVSVTVVRGKVQVQDANRILAVLNPDQQFEWKGGTQGSKPKVNIDANTVVAWKQGDLILDDITLEEAAVQIAERYNVKVTFANEKLKKCRFTAAFLNRNEIGQVLSVIGDITGAKLELKNNEVTINGQGC